MDHRWQFSAMANTYKWSLSCRQSRSAGNICHKSGMEFVTPWDGQGKGETRMASPGIGPSDIHNLGVVREGDGGQLAVDLPGAGTSAGTPAQNLPMLGTDEVTGLSVLDSVPEGLSASTSTPWSSPPRGLAVALQYLARFVPVPVARALLSDGDGILRPHRCEVVV